MPSTKKTQNLILVTQKEAVVELVLNRPEAHNAFSVELATELGRALKKVSSNKKIRAVILRGSEKAFSAGGDLKMFHASLPKADQAFRKITSLLNQAILLIRTMKKPVIAGVSGPAYAAGFGLTLACDLILASDSAKFSASFINIGLCPNGSSSLFLPRMIGFHRAIECFLTGRALSAQEALEWGIANRVVPQAQFEKALWEWAAELAAKPTQTIARTKLLLNESLGVSMKNYLEKEKQAIAWSATTPDFAEGVSAFVEKRKPHFKG